MKDKLRKNEDAKFHEQENLKIQLIDLQGRLHGNDQQLSEK